MIRLPNVFYINGMNNESSLILLNYLLKGESMNYIHELRSTNAYSICAYWFLIKFNI